MKSSRVLMIGLDGFELSIAERMMKQGRLPALRRLRENLSITHKYCDLRRRTCVKILESLESVVIPCRAPDSQFRVLNGGEKLQICVGLSI